MHFTIFNFLKEPDTDIFIENKNVSYGQFSPNIVKKPYCVCARVLTKAESLECTATCLYLL